MDKDLGTSGSDSRSGGYQSLPPTSTLGKTVVPSGSESRILKVIIAVAALHVLVLGSVFLINHGCKKPPMETARPEPAPMIPPTAPAVPPPGGVQPLPSTAYTTTPTTLAPAVPAPTVAPAPPVPPAPSAPTTKVYTIKQGDTLGKIAKLEGVSLSDLTAANPGINPKKLHVGQDVQIPVGGTTEAPGAAVEGVHAPTAAPKAATASGVYAVKKGDTLAKIARSQGTTVVALKKANGLSNDVIKVGQKLKIPTPSESGQRPSHEAKVAKAESTGGTVVEATGATHIVEAGETPAVIAKKYGVKVKDLLAANGNINPKHLKIGQKLVIPGKSGEAAPAPSAPAAPVAPAPSEATKTDTTGGVSGSAVAPSMTPAESPAPAPAPAPTPGQK